ncbi:hypothetical protein SAMN05192539_10764 [Paraburkholderia diazotrophica]|uniref:Uncharacterized protein n=1 Tax=Paraburkholderia diazotrophica TaxID=667676 RepID=A0A1H7EP47_9BURK|nr:hypothetical protein SAMN05192539_10764 [Paraburkholderia diazotrophica]
MAAYSVVDGQKWGRLLTDMGFSDGVITWCCAGLPPIVAVRVAQKAIISMAGSLREMQDARRKQDLVICQDTVQYESTGSWRPTDVCWQIDLSSERYG